MTSTLLFQPSKFDQTWCRVCDLELPAGFPVHFFGGGECRCEACLTKLNVRISDGGGRVDLPHAVPVVKELKVSFPNTTCLDCKKNLPQGSTFYWRSKTIGVCCMPPPAWAPNAEWFKTWFAEKVASTTPTHRLCEHCGACPSLVHGKGAGRRGVPLCRGCGK